MGETVGLKMELEERGGGRRSPSRSAKKQESKFASNIELATVTATVEIGHDDEMHGRRRRDPVEQAEETVVPLEGTEVLEMKFPLRTLALSSMVAAGIQFGWALQLSLLTPYIQTLGIEHAFSSFIWLCGPITGLVAQPCIGIWSDQCKSNWGRRRPFILSGAVMVAASVTIIGFSADIGYVLGDSHESCTTYKGIRPRAAIIFVLGFWLLDLANNTVQGPARALLADLAGPGDRDAANAIFVLWMAVGNILGFSTGASGQWAKWFPFLSSEACCEACANLKAAFLLAVIILLLCTMVTMIFAKEIPLTVVNRESLEKKHGEDVAPLLLQPDDSQLVMVNGVLQQVSSKASSNGTENNFRKDSSEKESLSSHGDGKMGSGPGQIMVNLLMGMRRLPSSMRTVLLVMAFCWLSWFPFFLFDTDWMGREVYQGNPQGSVMEINSYDQGVRTGAFGLLLNSVVLAISSLLIDPLCRRFGSKHVWALGNYIMFGCMVSTTIITAYAVGLHHGRSEHEQIYAFVKIGAIVLFTVLGFPLAITYSVPYSLTAELTAESGGGQGLAMGILNLAVVIPQMVVALGAGPWDELFGGGNMPAFALAGVFSLIAGIIASRQLPRMSRPGYQRAVTHGLG